MNTLVAVPLPVDLSATAIGAVQGAVFAGQVAKDRNIDLLGVVIVGIASGVGGGILRDLLLNERPAALVNPSYLTTVLISALAGMLFARLVSRLEPIVVAVDAAALGLYLVVGTGKALSVGLGTIPAIFVGVMACVGGTVIRDVLIRSQIALVQVGSLYAVAAISGGVVFVTLQDSVSPVVASIAAIAVTFGVRMASLWFGWRTPRPVSLDDALQKLHRE